MKLIWLQRRVYMKNLRFLQPIFCSRIALCLSAFVGALFWLIALDQAEVSWLLLWWTIACALACKMWCFGQKRLGQLDVVNVFDLYFLIVYPITCFIYYIVGDKGWYLQLQMEMLVKREEGHRHLPCLYCCRGKLQYMHDRELDTFFSSFIMEMVFKHLYKMMTWS